MGSSQVILLDTHVWIWLNNGDPRFTPAMQEHLAGSKGKVLLSSVSVWETMIAFEKGRLRGSGSPESHVRQWLAGYPFQKVPIDHEIAILSRSLPIQHEDPADRYLAATALYFNASLMTVDTRLRSLEWLDVFPPR